MRLRLDRLGHAIRTKGLALLARFLPAVRRIGEIALIVLGVLVAAAIALVALISGAIVGAYTWLRDLILEYLAVTLTILAVFTFLGFGISYWRNYPGLSWQLWQRCAYGDAHCSEAAATWTLASFAVLSFLAAARAVIWTRKLFEIEVQLKLGQSACVDRSESHINKEIFVTSESQVLLGYRPAGFTRDELSSYHEHHVAFTNLGRTALADVGVKLCLVDRNNVHSEQYPLHLGSIRCNDEIHVAVYIAKLFHDMKVLWGHATEQGKTLPFFAVDSLSAQPTFAFPDPQLPLPPMAQAINQPNGGAEGMQPKPPQDNPGQPLSG